MKKTTGKLTDKSVLFFNLHIIKNANKIVIYRFRENA